MRKKSFFSVLVALLFLCPVAYAQRTVYFSDSEQISGENLIKGSVVLNNTVIVGGTTLMDGTSPYLACYNASGQKVWKTSDSVRSVNALQLQSFTYGNDGYVYTVATGAGPLNSNTNYCELWKVRASDGKVVWKRTYLFQIDLVLQHTLLINKDSNTIALATVNTDIRYTGSWRSLSLIKKTNGDTFPAIRTGTYNGSNDNGAFGINSSKNGNIFYNNLNVLIKTDSTDPKKIIWKKAYKFTPYDSIYSIEKVFFSQSGRLFIVAGKGTSSFISTYVMEINPNSGDTIWMSKKITQDATATVVKEYKGYLYITFTDNFVGGLTEYFHIAKINMANGSIAWYSRLVATGKEISPLNTNSPSNYVKDITLDSTGNIYLTGYYGENFGLDIYTSGAQNYSILKIKGSDGSKISETDIALDSSRADGHSSGYVACILNNTPTFIGLNQPKGRLITLPSFVTFTQLDSNGKVKLFKNFGSYYRFPSSALQAGKNSKGQLIVLRQLGPTAMLTAYDSSMHIVWNTAVPKRDFGNMALRMTFNKTGTISVVSQGVKLQTTPPYYAVNKDSLYMTLFSDNGKFLKMYSMTPTSTSSSLTDPANLNLYGDSTEFYITYSGTVIRVDTVSRLVLNSFMANYPSGQGDLFASFSSTEILYLDAYNILRLDKSSLSTSATTFTAFSDRYNHLLRTGNHLFLCGYKNVLINYNLPKLDTVWKKYYDNQLGVFTKMVTDSNGYLYTMGTRYYDKTANTYDISIRKIATSTGKLIWTYNYTSPLLISSPTDIWYDRLSKTVSVSGYEKSGKNTNHPVAITLTRNGKLIAQYEPKPPVEADARATGIAGDSKNVYATGNMTLSSDLQNGFITSVQPDTLVPGAAFTTLGACVHAPIHFMNKSVNGSTYSWDFGDGSALSASASPTHTYSATGTYYITLKVTSTNSRVDSVRDTITIVADCVWPGDANADKKVDLKDLLSIGVAYGQTGSKRANASLNWEGQYAANWSKSFAGGANYKHANCNGDSVIDSKDTAAIRLNFSQTHLKRMEINEGEATDPLLYLKARNSKLNKGDTLIEDIFLGTSDIPANNIYGLAFNVSFDNSIFDATATRIDASAPWIKSGSAPFLFMNRNTSGEVDMAMVRTDANNQSGYGKIATLYIPVKESITAKQALLLSNNLAIDNSGKSLPLNLQNDTVSIPTSIDGMSASQEGITLYPNPFNGSTTVSYSLQHAGQVSITIRDITGRNIETVNKFSPEGTNQLKIDGLGKGIYFLEMNMNGQSKVFKLLSL